MNEKKKELNKIESSFSVKDNLKHGVVYRCRIYWQNIKTAFHYVFNDNKKNPRYI